jgi:hypothetical protein
MASYKSKAKIDQGAKKANPGQVNPGPAGGDGKLFHGYTPQQGPVASPDKSKSPGGPTHKVGNKRQVGGPYKPTGKPLRAGTRKNSLQGSDSTTAGTNRGKRDGGPDTAKKPRSGRIGPY